MTKFLAGLYGVIVILVALVASVAIADALQSPNYKFNETVVGGIGTSKTQSANYQASSTGGILGLGTSTGTMQINAGGTTTDDPTLAFAVNTASVNFGSFSAGSTAVTTSTFGVSNYTSYGYVVQALGNAPSNGSHTLAAMSTTDVSQAGTEQFGINLVANTSPISAGANPDHGQFGFGSATSNYGTSNNYRYVSGETIASAPKTSGTTIYTITYIINVSSLTPGGTYTSDQAILCTATF